jgi:porphobilinogen synthase
MGIEFDSTGMQPPFFRPRRLRDSAILRDAVAEFTVGPQHLMYPMFVADMDKPHDVQAMPGILKYPVPDLVREVEQLVERGLKSFILFGTPDKKDGAASAAYDPNGVVPRAIRAIKKAVGDRAFVCTDVCVCSYTDTGHCGVIHDGRLDNDKSIDVIARMALAHAEAGADMVAPSDMMDGRVGRIRETLDLKGLSHVPIMSYAIKYASSFYGPFRHAADSAPKFGDRRGYQMDFRNRHDAMREALLDEQEGADVLMVKPGIAYLDILKDLRDRTELPLSAYQVSGEYSMIRYAAMADAIDERAIVREMWTAFRRAGANFILTYHAAVAVREGWLA